MGAGGSCSEMPTCWGRAAPFLSRTAASHALEPHPLNSSPPRPGRVAQLPGSDPETLTWENLQKGPGERLDVATTSWRLLGPLMGRLCPEPHPNTSRFSHCPQMA